MFDKTESTESKKLTTMNFLLPLSFLSPISFVVQKFLLPLQALKLKGGLF